MSKKHTRLLYVMQFQHIKIDYHRCSYQHVQLKLKTAKVRNPITEHRLELLHIIHRLELLHIILLSVLCYIDLFNPVCDNFIIYSFSKLLLTNSAFESFLGMLANVVRKTFLIAMYLREAMFSVRNSTLVLWVEGCSSSRCI